jgi:hypothetical protein
MPIPTTCLLLPETQDATVGHRRAEAIKTDRYPVCHITYNRDAWVRLLQPPSEYSFDEALLLCQESPSSWVAWIPDHGEIVLDRGDFYC